MSDGMKTLFVIGMRRSGSSILKEIIDSHPEVQHIAFEPFQLTFALRTYRLQRYKHDNYIKTALKQPTLTRKKWTGAKLAYSPGVEALEWVYVPRVYKQAKIVFITRNPQANYKSYHNLDKKSTRGVLSKDAYIPAYEQTTQQWKDYALNNPDRACHIQYEDMLKDADKELAKVWKLMSVKPLENTQAWIKPPKFK